MNQRAIVERFYEDLWSQGREEVVHEICHAELEFEGSLGRRCRGREEFLGYVRMIRGALEDYTCLIDDLVEESDRIFAKARFRGRHTGELEGVAGTDREVEWLGAALFQFEGGQIRSLWVLGDRLALLRQLKGEAPSCSS